MIRRLRRHAKSFVTAENFRHREGDWRDSSSWRCLYSPAAEEEMGGMLAEDVVMIRGIYAAAARLPLPLKATKLGVGIGRQGGEHTIGIVGLQWRGTRYAARQRNALHATSVFGPMGLNKSQSLRFVSKVLFSKVVSGAYKFIIGSCYAPHLCRR